MNIQRRYMLALLLLAALTCGALRPSQAQQQPTPTRNRGVVAGPIITLPRGQGDPQLDQPTAEATKRSPVQRWEYCAIMSFTTEKRSTAGPVLSVAYICYFREEGCAVETVDMEGADNRQHVAAKAIAHLGAEGWELVGLGPGQTNLFGIIDEHHDGMLSSPFVLYFKRPL
jgi:hypothetical protein